MANVRDEDRTGDILIQEVDEDLRREEYLKLWRRYGAAAIAIAVAVVVVFAGWQAWLGWQKDQRDQAAARYAAAVALIDAGKTKEAEAALAAIEGGDKGFAILAGMSRAQLLAKDGDLKGAMAAYEQIAASDAPELLRDLAALKEGLLALSLPGDTGAVENHIAGLAVAGQPWYYQATEEMALFARKKGDDKHAVELFKRLADDAHAPQQMRARAAEMLAALAPPSAVAASDAAPAAAPAAEGAKK
jgi:hypothetical protein